MNHPIVPLLQRYLVSSIFILSLGVSTQAVARGGKLRIDVVDAQTQQPLSARIHLKNQRGRPVKPRAQGAVHYKDHFCFSGKTELTLPRGHFTFVIETSNEYLPQTGHFEIMDNSDDQKTIEMRRFVNLREEGWYGGDLIASRPEAHLPLLKQTEGLSVMASLSRGTAKANQDGVLHRSATGQLVEFNRERPPLKIVAVASSWELPIWLAEGTLAAIAVLDETSTRETSKPLPRGCRPPPPRLYSGKTGVGRWHAKIYEHVLNCGFRIPPVAGSGSGWTVNPPGQNRVYVHLDEESGEEAWWEGLQEGRVFVTNGPLLRATANGIPPGYSFNRGPGTLVLEIAANLATAERIAYLQIVKNGEIEHEIALDEYRDRKGKLPPLEFAANGWFSLRAVTENVDVYRYAATGPWYVGAKEAAYMSEESVGFFQTWLNELAAHKQLSANISPQRIEAAQKYWKQLAARARGKTP